MTAVVAIPAGARPVLENVALGRSPWHGWEAGTLPRSAESQDAYEARARVITACRQYGLLTAENLLTDDGRRAVKVMGERGLG